MSELEPKIDHRQQQIRHIVQSMLAEAANQMFTPDYDDEVWWQAHNLHENNMLPPDVTADDVYSDYLSYWEGE